MKQSWWKRRSMHSGVIPSVVVGLAWFAFALISQGNLAVLILLPLWLLVLAFGARLILTWYAKRTGREQMGLRLVMFHHIEHRWQPLPQSDPRVELPNGHREIGRGRCADCGVIRIDVHDGKENIDYVITRAIPDVMVARWSAGFMLVFGAPWKSLAQRAPIGGVE